MRSAAPRGLWRPVERLAGPAVTLTAVLAIEALAATTWWIPNPPALLMLAIVFAAFRGDAASGWISAAISWTYCLYYFSDSVYPLVYTVPNLRRVIIWGLVFPLTAAMVGRLRRYSELAESRLGHQERLEVELGERRVAESALRESEARSRASSARFQAIADSAPVGIFETDARGKTLFVNRLWRELTGKTLEDATGDRWLEAVHPADRERVAAGWLRKDGGERALEATYRLVNPAGDARWVEGHAVELRDDAGELTGYLGTLVDVTGIRTAERIAQRRGAILSAAGFAGQALLLREDWESAIPEVLARLGEAAGVSRTYLFENSRDARGELLASLRFEWVAAGVDPQIDRPDLQQASYGARGLSRWETTFLSGGMIHGSAASRPDQERALLESQGILSLAVLPILIAGEPWGFLGFDDCAEARDWSVVELDALRAAAATIAAAIERQTALLELRASESRFRDLFDNSPVELWEEDYSRVHAYLTECGFLAAPSPRAFLAERPDVVREALKRVRVRDVNRKAVETLGAPDKETLLGALEQIFTAEAYAAFAAELVAMHRGERRLASESVARTLDGRRVDVVLQWEVQPGHESDYSRVLVSVLDVSELRQTERALQAQARYSAAVVDAVGQPLVVLDEQLRIRFANAAFHRVLGTGDSTVVESPLLGLLDDPLLAAKLEGALRNVLAGEDSIDAWEVEWQTPSAGRKSLVLSARRFGATAAPQETILVAMEDVTESRAMRREIESSRRLESVGKMAGGIAHDFNNLLTVILNSADFLAPALEEREAPLADLRRIQTAGRQAAALTHQLLAFSRRQVLSPRVVDINGAIRELRDLLVRVLPESIETKLDLAAEPGLVEVDPAQIEQVLLNLAVNARDAMPGGGTIEIATRGPGPAPEEMPAREAPFGADGILIVVTDDGSGMDAETLERCFEPFFSTKAAPEGTGLGLATAYGIVRQSGGAIWAESAEGRGTKLSIFLPRPSASPAPAASKSSEDVRQGKERILLVEDDDSVRSMILRMLRGLGYQVHEARTPTAALAAARSGSPFDLLITDVVMAEMDGTRLAAELAELPVLFVSGYAIELVERESSARIQFLQKPFTLAALAAAVRQALDPD